MRPIILSIALFLALPALAQAQGDANFAPALASYDRARNGERGQVERAIAAFEALSQAEPAQPLYAAYLGSAITLKARDAWMPWNKLRYTEAGLERIDQALAALRPEHDRQLLRGAPVGVETRLVAALTFVKIPDSLFHRRAAGRKLIDDLTKRPALVAAPAGLRASVYIAAAQLAREDGRASDEQAYLNQALAASAAGVQADQARARLIELGQ